MTRDRTGRAGGGRSELPVDPAYWSNLADRIESDALPELRAALHGARDPGSLERWLSSERAAWLEWIGRLGRWAVPATALACALWLVVTPSQETARYRVEVSTDSSVRSTADTLAPDAWREAVLPDGSLGRLMAQPTMPSVGQLLPWSASSRSEPSTGKRSALDLTKQLEEQP